jgi:sortase (surface protein transpeptidase)
MRILLIFLIFVLSLSLDSNAQNNQNIAEKAKAWQQTMSQKNHRMNIRDNNKSSEDNSKNSIPQYRLPYYHNRWNKPAMPIPPIGYFPIIQWYPYGTQMDVGPVFVSPDRRYVRFGINAGFSRYDGFETYQMKK